MVNDQMAVQHYQVRVTTCGRARSVYSYH